MARGVLSVLDDNGYPYGIPMNHWYNEEDGKLYFLFARNFLTDCDFLLRAMDSE